MSTYVILADASQPDWPEALIAVAAFAFMGFVMWLTFR